MWSMRADEVTKHGYILCNEGHSDHAIENNLQRNFVRDFQELTRSLERLQPLCWTSQPLCCSDEIRMWHCCEIMIVFHDIARCPNPTHCQWVLFRSYQHIISWYTGIRVMMSLFCPSISFSCFVIYSKFHGVSRLWLPNHFAVHPVQGSKVSIAYFCTAQSMRARQVWTWLRYILEWASWLQKIYSDIKALPTENTLLVTWCCVLNWLF